MDPNMQNQQQIQPIPEPYSNDGDKVDLDDIKGKIFIGGLSWQTTELNLRYYFEKFGELSDVALMIDKRSGKPRYWMALLVLLVTLLIITYKLEGLGLLK